MPKIKYGYCAVGNDLAGPALVDSIRTGGAEALDKLGMERIEYPKLIRDTNMSIEAADFFHQKKVESLIVNFAGFPGGGALLRLASELSDVSLVLWGYAKSKGAAMPLTCLIEGTSDYIKTNKRFFVVVGDPEEASTIQEIGEKLRAIDAYRFVQRANIGYMGYACPGMVDVCVDEISLRRQMGCELFHLDLIELVREYQQIKDGEAAPLVNELKNKAGKVMVAEKEIFESCRLYLAMQKIAQRYQLNAITMRCWPELREVPPNHHVTPCYGISRLTDEGVMAVCEADVTCAVMMLLMQRLTGKAPATLDFLTMDVNRNSLALSHCGANALSLAENIKDVAVRVPPLGGAEEWGGGCALEFSIKEGKATVAKLKREYDKMSIATGQFVKPSPMRGGLGEVVFDNNVRDYLYRIMDEGFEHHVCAVHGNVTNELVNICKLAQIKPINC